MPILKLRVQHSNADSLNLRSFLSVLCFLPARVAVWLQKAFLLASTKGRPNGILPAPEHYSANGPSARLLEICGMVGVQTEINQVIELHCQQTLSFYEYLLLVSNVIRVNIVSKYKTT